MGKGFDSQVLATSVLGVVEDTFEKMVHAKCSAPPVVTERDIIEYDGNMRVFPLEKFNAPCYVTYVNFFLNDADLKAERNVIGTFVFFVKEEVAEKLLRAFNHSLKDAENEDVLTDICGEMCNILTGNIKNELTDIKYVELSMSVPYKFKNHIPAGVPFDYHLFTKHEFVFSFWGQKCIVIEACMGDVPLKGR